MPCSTGMFRTPTWSMEKFFEAGHYDDDPALWNLSNDENDNETLDVFRRLDERK